MKKQSSCSPSGTTLKLARYFLFSMLFIFAALAGRAASTTVVISQAYGGGGNSGSVYKNDFIELFNKSASPVSLSGWSVQYTSSAGTSWSPNITPLSGTIQPYSYYLVQEASGAGGTTALPTPDATGSIAMGAGGFKVALCNSTTALTGSNPVGSSQLVDFLGAAANAFEGSAAAPAPSNTTSDLRANGGCTDTDNNGADFTAGTVNPRNSSSPTNFCTGGGSTGLIRVETKADGSGIVVPAQSLTAGNSITVYAISRDASSNFVANVAADSWSLLGKSGKVVDADLVAAGDLKSAVFTGHGAGTASIHASSGTLNSTDSGTITVTAGTAAKVQVETAVDGTGTVVPAENVFVGHSVTFYAIRRDAYSNFVDNVAATAWSLPTKTGSVADGDLTPAGDLKSAVFTGNGFGTATVRATAPGVSSVDSGLLTVTSTPPAAVVISQIYGGGGNSGTTYSNDFVELFNRTANPVSIDGWSVQYASSTGAFGGTGNFINFTNKIIQPYSYFLIMMGSGTVSGSTWPMPGDVTNYAMNLGAAAGKLALANTYATLGTVSSLPDPRIVDMIGYGGASLFEGSGPAPAPDNTTGELRNNTGCSDTDNNSVDFTLGTPSPRNSSITTNACPTNTPPIISTVPNQSIAINSSAGPVTFTISDSENAASTLTLSVDSSNPGLIPTNNIVFGGSGVVRNVTLTPLAGQQGSSAITVTVTDPVGAATTTTFYLFVGDGPQLGLIFYENFNEFANGTALSLAGDSSIGPWHNHSGTFYQMIVSNGAAQVSIPITNSEDIHADLTNVPIATSSGATLYVGFSINEVALPTGSGEYFLHLKDTTTSNFYCRVFATATNAAPGKYRLGLSNRNLTTTPNVVYPMDLDLNTTYYVVARYKVGVASSSLWINPGAVTDPSVTATDVATPGEVDQVALRESGTTGFPSPAGSQVIDNIVVSTLFADAIPPKLKATVAGGNVVISWPTNNFSYTLETNVTFLTPWSPASPAPTVVGANYVVTNVMATNRTFYRLQGTP